MLTVTENQILPRQSREEKTQSTPSRVRRWRPMNGSWKDKDLFLEHGWYSTLEDRGKKHKSQPITQYKWNLKLSSR